MNGTRYAFHRMYEAWKATQPQLFWTDENLWGLDDQETVKRAECPAAALLIVEPGRDAALPLKGGLGTYNGDGANHIQVARRPQKGA